MEPQFIATTYRNIIFQSPFLGFHVKFRDVHNMKSVTSSQEFIFHYQHCSIATERIIQSNKVNLIPVSRICGPHKRLHLGRPYRLEMASKLKTSRGIRKLAEHVWDFAIEFGDALDLFPNAQPDLSAL